MFFNANLRLPSLMVDKGIENGGQIIMICRYL